MSIHAVDEMVRSAKIEGSRSRLIERSFEVEQAALAAFMFDYVQAGDRPVECPPGYEDDFLEPAHRTIWQAIRSVADDRRVVTPGAVYARLGETDRGDEIKPYLAALGKSLAIGQPADALRLVREMANRRRLIDRARELEEQAYKLDLSPADAIASIASDLEAIKLDRQSTPRTLREVALRIADALGQPLRCYSTGLPRLDGALGGGIFERKLYGIAAKRKSGKTITAGTLASNIAFQGVPTLFFALEMGEEGIAQRIIAKQLRTNSLAYLSRGNEHLERDTRNFANRCDVPLFFEDRPGLEISALRSIASEYVARHGVKVIVVDYWQLIGGRHHRQSKVDHLDGVAQWMADFAKGSGAAVIMPAQLNREGETRDGDGLRMACDMYLVQHKVMQPDGRTQGLWFEVPDSRYTETIDIGSSDVQPFFIGRAGPALEEFSA